MSDKELYINFDEHIRLTENEQVPNKFEMAMSTLP